MATTKTYQDYSELAWASYGVGFIAGSYIDKDKNNILTDPNNEVKFTSIQAKAFTDRYEVLATSAQYGIGTANSFDAVLFGERDIKGNIINKVLAVRGTQGPIDILVDIVELGGTGTVVSQTASMESFYQALISNNKLTATEHVNVTGHSLGGFITQVFTAKHSNIVDHAYTYNAPGVGGLKVEVYQQLGIIPANIDTTKITNVIATDSLTLIAGFGVMAGEIVEIPGGSHSIVDVTKTLTQMNASGTNGHTLTYSSLNASQKSTLDTVSNWIMSKIGQAGNLAEGVIHGLQTTIETIHDALFNPSAQVSAKIVDGNLSFSDGQQTIVSSITNNGTTTTHTYDAYTPTGDLIGRTTSQYQTGDFIAVPNASSPSATIEALHQTEFRAVMMEKYTIPTTSVAPVTNTTVSNPLPSVPYNFYNSQNQTINYGFTTGNNGGVSNYPSYGNSSFSVFFPVILDLDGDGIELVSKEQSHAWFDTAGDGTLHKSGWVGADDGLLVYDENNDGKVTTREMAFAMRTTVEDSDLQALANEFDSNHDGKLDSNDTQFSQFRMWKDTNGNGETDAGELMTLAGANVASVGLNPTAASIDIEGNKISGFATYTKADGTNGSVADTAFGYDSLGYTVAQKIGYTQLSQKNGPSYALATDSVLNLNLVSAGVDGAIGSTGNDTLDATGKTTNTVLEGGSGNDVLTGGNGDDWFKGGSGNDTINGGSGKDEAKFSGQMDDYVFFVDSAGILYVKDQTAGSNDGFDTLLNIENISFSNGKYSFAEAVLKARVNSLEYIASYTDLINAFGANVEAGAKHYLQYGRFENRTTTFDAHAYLASYTDLMNAFGANAEAGAKHYMQHGRFENRAITFDSYAYLASYTDLMNAFGSNADAGEKHYINNGRFEGRTITFDSYAYLASYTDLMNAFGANAEAGAKHYLNYGRFEERTTTFDAYAYLAGYADLIYAFGANIEAGAKHYINYGRFEGRDVGESYNVILGSNTNDSLSGSQNKDALYGFQNDDTLNGKENDDFIYGDIGNDSIRGETGNDTLHGGVGLDTYIFDTSLNQNTNRDTILDFSHLDDTIGLENSIFTKLTITGVLNSDFFKVNASGIATDANDYIVYNTSNGNVSYDPDGNGANTAIVFATLLNKPQDVTYTDFSVI